MSVENSVGFETSSRGPLYWDQADVKLKKISIHLSFSSSSVFKEGCLTEAGGLCIIAPRPE